MARSCAATRMGHVTSNIPGISIFALSRPPQRQVRAFLEKRDKLQNSTDSFVHAFFVSSPGLAYKLLQSTKNLKGRRYL